MTDVSRSYFALIKDIGKCKVLYNKENWVQSHNLILSFSARSLPDRYLRTKLFDIQV